MALKLKINWRKSLFLPAGVLLLALLLLNAISRNWFVRLDLTDNRMYSLSSSSRSVINQIDDLLTMKVYFSQNLPGVYGNNRRYLQDILEEYAAYAGGDIRFEFYPPESTEELAREAQQAGIQPVQLQVIENDKMEVKRVFMGMVILYEDQREILPVIQTSTGLEYEITTRIKKLVETDKKTLALARRVDQQVRNNQVTQLLRQRYQVVPQDLSQPLPDHITVLLMNGVEDSLTAPEKENLEAFLARGGNLLLAQGRVKTNLQFQRAEVIRSDIFDLVNDYGFSLADNLVLDRICGQVNVQQSVGFIRMNVPMSYPFLPLVRRFSREEPVVSGLEQVQLLFPSEIVLDDSLSTERGVTTTALMYSSDHSSSMTGRFNLSPDPQFNPGLLRLEEAGKVLAARAEKVAAGSDLVSQLILVADSKFLADEGGGMVPENHVFILNAVDYLMGDRELIDLRSREITSRPLAEVPAESRRRWKWINMVLPPLLIVGFGFLRMRRRSSRSKDLEALYD